MKELKNYIGKVYRNEKYNEIFRIISSDYNYYPFDLEIQYLNKDIANYLVRQQYIDDNCTDITNIYYTEGYQLLIKLDN